MSGNLKFVIIGVLLILIGWWLPSVKGTIISDIFQNEIKRPLSGTFEVPAGKVVHTGILITEKDIQKGVHARFIQDGPPKEFWFVNGAGGDIKINEKIYLMRLIFPPGEIQFRGGSKPIKVRVEIID